MSDSLPSLLNRGFRYARALTGDRAAAEDLVQDAWASVLQAGGPHEAAYLFRAIRSRFVDGRRRSAVVPMVPLVEPERVPGPERAMPSDHAPLWAAFDQLPADQREALYLCVVEGHTAAEVGEITGVPRNTVLSWLHRGRARLRAVLVGQNEPATSEVLP